MYIKNSGAVVVRDVRFDVEFLDSDGRIVTGTRLELNSLASGEDAREIVTVLAPAKSTRVTLPSDLPVTT